MEQVKWVAIFIAVLSFIAASAQDQEPAARPAQSTGQSTGSSPDSSATKNIQQGSDMTGAGAENSADKAARSGNTTNAGGLIQETSSGSGSPALLSGKNGTERDGTNNVQRAHMNMAGSPVDNLRLNDRQPADVNAEMDKGRQRVTAPATTRSSQINNNNRRENNALSDQNLSSKKNKTPISNGGKKNGKKSGGKKAKG
ncbi:MAG TPA: hypothetical protein VF490_14935 [Chryseosolibacter sp.]